MPTTIPANNPSRLHRFGFSLAKLVKQPLKFATTDKLRWEIITKAINLISAPLTLQDLETLTASVTEDGHKYSIIKTVIEKNLIPTLTLQDLETLTELVTEDKHKSAIRQQYIYSNLRCKPGLKQLLPDFTILIIKDDYAKCSIIKQAIENNLTPTLTLQDLEILTELVTEDWNKYSIIKTFIEKNPTLTLQDLKTLTKLVTEDWNKCDIIKQGIENNLTPKLTPEQLQTLTPEQLKIITLEQLKTLTASVTKDVYKCSIIKTVIEKNLIPTLTLQDVEILTELVTEDKYKCAVFIEALNKGMQLTPENDLEHFGLDKDDPTKRFEMIRDVLTYKKPIVITCSALLNLVTLVSDEQKDIMIKYFLKHEGVKTCSALLQLVTLVSDEQKNTMIETVFRQKLILEPEIKFLKVAIFCQKLKNLALNPGQTTPAEENEEAAESAIRKYINNDLFTNTKNSDQENSFFTTKEMQKIVAKIEGPIIEKEKLYKKLSGIGRAEIDFFFDALKSGLNCAWEDNIELRREFVEKIREEEKNRQQPSANTPNNSPVVGVCSMLSQTSISNSLGLCQAG
jgi:DNA-binding GntR family transcriptional regulator